MDDREFTKEKPPVGGEPIQRANSWAAVAKRTGSFKEGSKKAGEAASRGAIAFTENLADKGKKAWGIVAARASGGGQKFMDLFKKKKPDDRLERADSIAVVANPYEERKLSMPDEDGDLPQPDLNSISDPLDKYVASLPFSQMKAERFISIVDNSTVIDVVDLEQLKAQLSTSAWKFGFES